VRILVLHNRYKIGGGEDVTMQTEKALLEAHNHVVALVEVTNDEIISLLDRMKAAFKCIYSFSARRRVLAEIKRFNPDIVHVHNFFPLLSPSVYYACQQSNIPVVQTLQNYRLFCLNSYFFRDGKVCEDCFGKPFALPGVIHACYQGSKVGSAIVGTMQFTHRALKTWEKAIDLYITVTEFARQKYIQGNLPASKLVVKPNFLYPDPQVGQGQGNYALFVGRLSPEKGLDTLIKAWQRLGSKVPLKIVGEGPLCEQIIAASQTFPGIEYLGKLPKYKVLELMKDAQILVFPSLWYEGFPLVIVEAYAVGLPVIAANLGSQSSLIEHRRTGLHFQPGDPNDLVAQVEWALAFPDEIIKMRQAARAEFEMKYTDEKNYQMLMKIYQQAIWNKKQELSLAENR
jgi:glycosyltransferase involved in cell wall biosynthesis